MENEVFAYTIGNFIIFINFVESIILSLEDNCFKINERINCLYCRINTCQESVLALDFRKDFKKAENFSIRDFMLIDDSFFLRNSYYCIQDCKKLLVLVKENFPKFFENLNLKRDKFKFKPFAEKLVDVEMDEKDLYKIVELRQLSRKDIINAKSKKCRHSKSWKISNLRHSIEKLLHIRSHSEKSLKNEDLFGHTIPETIYLTPNQQMSLSQTYVGKHLDIKNPKINDKITRHSCSDFICRRSSTFCVYEANTEKLQNDKSRALSHRTTSPPPSAFYPVFEENTQTSFSAVPHSKSVPMQLSISQQNLNKTKLSHLDLVSTPKRTSRKKGILNCSVFRKRSSSRSKSIDKINQPTKPITYCNKTKSLSRSAKPDEYNGKNLTDRSLTLPNLKSSEIDLSAAKINNPQLFSIDLIKDYLNQSDCALSSSVHGNSLNKSIHSTQNQSCISAQNSPHSISSKKSLSNDKHSFLQSAYGIRDSEILEDCYIDYKPNISACNNGSITSKNDIHSVSTSRSNSALDRVSYNGSIGIVNPTSTTNNDRKHFVRQVSAPQYHTKIVNPRTTSVTSPPAGAFEFWTRPMQEKLNASRRRFIDDKVGSKEALLRSLSPHSTKFREDDSLYEIPCRLQMIPEPAVTKESISDLSKSSFTQSMSLSNFIYNPISQRYSAQENIYDCQQIRPSSPLVENRLLEPPSESFLPKSNIHSSIPNYLISEQLPMSNIGLSGIQILSGQNEIMKINQKDEKIRKSSDNFHSFDEQISGFKDNKSLKSGNSSTDLFLTRTPSPPHSFAESSVSSIPVPKEFITESSLPQSKSSRSHNVNLAYTSDNSSYEEDDMYVIHQEIAPPVPPPRTDSVFRSLQNQTQQNQDGDKSELEYDISDEFLPIFTNENVDHCDFKQYKQWLERLPYKLSEFPDLLHSRKCILNSTPKFADENNELKKLSQNVILGSMDNFSVSRKDIKSWNTSDIYNICTEEANISHGDDFSVSDNSLKKSFSCDQSLTTIEKNVVAEGPLFEVFCNQIENSPNQTLVDCTLLKQYSHLYSLKVPLPDDVVKEMSTSSLLKSVRSKSIDFRSCQLRTAASDESIVSSVSSKRKSVPNSKYGFVKMQNNAVEIPNYSSETAQYKIYPMQ